MFDHENKRPRGFGFITFSGARARVCACWRLAEGWQGPPPGRRGAAQGRGQTAQASPACPGLQHWPVLTAAALHPPNPPPPPRPAEEEAVDAVFARGTLHTLHDKQVEIKRAVPRDSMPPSPRTLHRGAPPMHHHAGPPGPLMGYGEPQEGWHRGRGPPPQYGGRGGYGGGPGGGYRGGYGPPPMHHQGGMGGHHGGYGGGRGGGMRSPPQHRHGGGGLPPQPFTPPAVVTGAPRCRGGLALAAACARRCGGLAAGTRLLLPHRAVQTAGSPAARPRAPPTLVQASLPTWRPRPRARPPSPAARWRRRCP